MPELIDIIKKSMPFEPEVALILGSGLGRFADSLEVIETIEAASLPGYPASTVQGHSGKLIFAKYRRKSLLLFQGRVHLYEGYSLKEALIPVKIVHSLGIKKLILSNAAGGISAKLRAGDLMLIRDFNLIQLRSELAGVLCVNGSLGQGKEFPSHSMDQAIRQGASEEGIELKEGIYYYSKGPSYETPAEIRMMSFSGADAVGMSTAHEAVYASSLGIETSAISLITNMASGISQTKLSHLDVMETAGQAKEKFERLIKKTIELCSR